MNRSILLFVFAIVQNTYAIMSIGKCANVSVINDFDMNKVADFFLKKDKIKN